MCKDEGTEMIDENLEDEDDGLTEHERMVRRSLEEDGCCSEYYEKPSLYPEDPNEYADDFNDGFDDEDFYEDED